MPPASPLPSPSYPPITSPTPRHPDLNPNPHPYAIKTTSTALLSRSNSSGFNTNAARNHYVPISPSPTRNRSSASGSKHRSSQSQYIPEASPTKAPRPLPTPPPTGIAEDKTATSDADPPRRARRADTLPSAPAPFTSVPATVSVADLPSNPKLWTPRELASYLVTALRVTTQGSSGDHEEVTLPARVAKDIAAFVKGMHMTGRIFLRLDEDDLVIMGVNQKWREALLRASRTLRQNVLKGRIWGADLDPELEGVASPSSSRPSSTSSSPSRPLPTPPSFNQPAFYHSPSGSAESLNANGVNDDIRPKRHRNGRVRGMVETFERSGSFSSDAGSVDEGRPLSILEDWRNEARRKERDDDALSVSSRDSPEPESPLLADATFTADTTAVDIDEGKIKDAATVSEPSIEELLAASDKPVDPKRGSWGARAWEELDLEPGVTVKRIPTDESDPAGDTIVASGSRNSSGRNIGRGTLARGRKDDRRVVTAIFAPSAAATAEEPLPEAVQGDAGVEQSRPLPPLPGISELRANPVDEPHVEQEYNPVERALLAELADTRALLEVFRARLEDVEDRLSVLEEKDREITGATQKTDTELADSGCARCQASDEPATTTPEAVSGSSLLSQASQLLPPFVTSFAASASASAVSRRPRSSIRNADSPDDEIQPAKEPASVSDIPSYVILVGIGVCAIVLKVMLKRVGGRRG